MKSPALIALALLAAAVPAAPPPFPTATARAFLEAATPRIGDDGILTTPQTSLAPAARRAQAELRRLAASADPRTRALALFALGSGELHLGQLDAARADLGAAAAFPDFAEAAAAALVPGLVQAKDYAGALAAAPATLSAASVFYPVIANAAATAAEQQARWPQLLAFTAHLPLTPPVLRLRAEAAGQTGDTATAAGLLRTLEFHFPASPEAAQMLPQWQSLSPRFPALAPDWQLLTTQAQAWTAARRFRDAMRSLQQAEALAPPSSRPELMADEARALLGAGDRAAAASAIASLEEGPERPQALEIGVELARATRDESTLNRALASLRALPPSPYFAQALHEAGDEALLQNQPPDIITRFDELVARFPDSAYAPEAAWQAAWAAYRTAAPDTPARLERYLVQFPHGAEDADAIYWRGRWAADHDDASLAQSCWAVAARHFPGSYFGEQSLLRRRGPRPAATPDFLAPFDNEAAPPPSADPPPALQPELDRAALLADAWLLEPAEALLSDAARQAPASLPLARRLATVATSRQDWRGAIVALEHVAPGYLRLPADALSVADWHLLYPRPLPALATRTAAANSIPLDIFYGLMRQESAFDPNSISPAAARGLMQLELATAKAHLATLSPTLRALVPSAGLDNDALLQPALNLALGGAELGSLLRRFPAPAYAIAGYDAGAVRVDAWRISYPTTDIPAFIESIPFSETRGYVQAVLRNAARYRALYADVSKSSTGPRG